jgi:uncharacterized protein
MPALCPICERPPQPKFRPFCSKRCADIDLGRWLKGAYAIPAVETPELDEEPASGQANEPPL